MAHTAEGGRGKFCSSALFGMSDLVSGITTRGDAESLMVNRRASVYQLEQITRYSRHQLITVTLPTDALGTSPPTPGSWKISNRCMNDAPKISERVIRCHVSVRGLWTRVCTTRSFTLRAMKMYLPSAQSSRIPVACTHKTLALSTCTEMTVVKGIEGTACSLSCLLFRNLEVSLG